MSAMENCVLVDPVTGDDICRLTRQEAESMVVAGSAARAGWKGKKKGTHKYRLVVPVAPSNSFESAPMLNHGDMRALVSVLFKDGRVSIERAERLAGWGFHIKRAACKTCKKMVPMPHPACV